MLKDMTSHKVDSEASACLPSLPPIETAEQKPVLPMTSLTVKPLSLSRTRGSQLARNLPDVEVPPKQPLTSHLVKEATLKKIWAVMKRPDACPLIQFLSEVANCYDFHTTPWVACNVIPGAKVRKCCYMAPVPEDVPGFARRLLNVPDQLSSTSVWRLVRDPEEHRRLVLNARHQDTVTRRCDSYSTATPVTCSTAIALRCNAPHKGCIAVTKDKPLPWTHGVVRHFIEHRARHDALAMGGDLVRCIQEAVDAPDLPTEHSEE
eukprot:g27869.t1